MNEVSSQYTRVIAAIESTPGTDAVQTILTTATADIVYQNLRNVSIQPVKQQVGINRTRGSHSGVNHLVVNDVVNVSCEIPLTGRAGAGAGNEAPYYAPFLRAANLKEVIDAGNSATYTPSTGAGASITLYVYERVLESEQYRLTVVAGVRGNLTINAALNGELFAAFEGQGVYQGEQSEAATFFNATTGKAALLKDGATAVTARTTGTEIYANTSPIKCSDMGFTLNDGGGADSWYIKDFSMATNWTISQHTAINAAANVVGVNLTRGADSRIGGSFNMIDGDRIDDLIAAYSAASSMALELVATEGDGGSGSARITLTADNAQLGPATKGDDAGRRSYAIPWFANGDWTSLVADNDFALVFDAVA